MVQIYRKKYLVHKNAKISNITFKVSVNLCIIYYKYTCRTYVTSWDKISCMSQFFYLEVNIQVFRPRPVLKISEN